MLLRRLSVLALAILSLGGAVALANHNKFLSQTLAQATDSQSPPYRNRNGLVQELNLTSDQTQKLKTIRKQYKDQITQTNLQLRQAQQELRNLVASTASANQVREKYHQVQGLQQQLADLRFESMLATRELLTPEQRIKFVEHMQNHSSKVQKPMMPTQQPQS